MDTTALDSQELTERVESVEDRTERQQTARDRITAGWRWLYIGVGIVIALFAFTAGQYGLPLLLSYWVAGFIIFRALRTLVFEPRLDEKYPLSRSRVERRAHRSRSRNSATTDNTTSPLP